MGRPKLSDEERSARKKERDRARYAKKTGVDWEKEEVKIEVEMLKTDDLASLWKTATAERDAASKTFYRTIKDGMHADASDLLIATFRLMYLQDHPERNGRLVDEKTADRIDRKERNLFVKKKSDLSA